MKSVIIGAHLQRTDIEPDAAAIPVGELFLSAVELPDDQPLGDRDLLLRVASARARLLDRATFIAIRYGFSVHSAQEAAAKCAERIDRWRELLTAHHDEVEMTLKIAASAPAPRPDRHAFAAGGDYLRALQQSARAVDIDPSFRAAVERLLVPLAARSRWLRETSAIELAMLVRRAGLDRVRDAGERLRSEHPAIPFLLSGPWPLEVFADDDRQ